MKHVPQLGSEPHELAAYRAELGPISPDAKPETIWESFKSHSAFGAIRQALLVRQQGLCGYCEQRLVDADGQLILMDQQLEHVTPKSSDVAVTLDTAI